MNAYLLLLPQWVTAIYLVAALVGFAGWSTPLGTRIGLAACLYLMAFAVVGQSFNQYWGCARGPALMFRRSAAAGVDRRFVPCSDGTRSVPATLAIAAEPLGIGRRLEFRGLFLEGGQTILGDRSLAEQLRSFVP